MLQKQSFVMLRNAEFLQQSKDLAAIIANNNPTALQIKKQYDIFLANITNFEEVFKQQLKSKFTETIVELDEKRDQLFTGIANIVEANQLHWLPATKQQAKLLLDSINIFGKDIIKANFQEETASLNSLIDKWEKDATLTSALTTLGLDSWKTELKTTNQIFAATYNERAVESGLSENLPKTKKLRKDLQNAWGKLRNIIEGKIEEYEDDTVKAPLYKTLANNINGVLQQYSNLLAQRKGIAQSQENKATPPPSNT